MVEIVVGREEKSFCMHKGLLCNTAPYFRAAFEGRFIEAQTRILRPSDEDPNTFNQFQLWAYTDKILQEGETHQNITVDRLVKLYLFGSMYGISALQNAAMDLFIDKQLASHSFLRFAIIPQIYEKTLAGAPLRRFLVDYCACHGSLDTWFGEDKKEDFGYFTKEFLADLAVAMYRIRKGTLSRVSQGDWRAVRGEYHVPTWSAS